MEPTAIISIAAFLIAVFSLMWQININGMRDELLEAIRRNREEIRENRKALQPLDCWSCQPRTRTSAVGRVQRQGLSEDEREQARLEGFNGRLSDVELEQARLEGANRILGDAIRRQSHTREGD